MKPTRTHDLGQCGVNGSARRKDRNARGQTPNSVDGKSVLRLQKQVGNGVVADLLSSVGTASRGVKTTALAASIQRLHHLGLTLAELSQKTLDGRGGPPPGLYEIFATGGQQDEIIKTAIRQKLDLKIHQRNSAHLTWSLENDRFVQSATWLQEAIKYRLRGQPAPLREPSRAGSDWALEVPSPELEEQHRRLGIQLPTVERESADPRVHADFIENRIQAVGFGVYLGGYFLFCEGFDLPIFLPADHVDFSDSDAVPINYAIHSSHAEARSILSTTPPESGHSGRYAFARGAGGRLIVPTIISRASAPRTFETITAARRDLGRFVTQELTTVAVTLLGGIVVRAALSVIARLGGRSTGARDANVVGASIHRRIKPVNERINIGGGFEEGAAGASNVQPFIEGTGGPSAGAQVPNLVRARFEEIDQIFEHASASSIFSNRLPHRTVNWRRAAQAASRVMKSGGRLSLNVWTHSQAEVREVIHAFTRAGFRDVRNITGQTGSATVITGVRR